MKIFLKPSVLIATLSILLSACFGPESPQDVATGFWQAVTENNAANASRYSTIDNTAEFDAFRQKWSGATFASGRVVIDGNQASIDSTYTDNTQPSAQPRSFTTYLILKDDRWLVDYARTANSMHGGAFGELFNTFNRVGQELAKQFNRSSQQAGHELERMMEQLNTRQRQLTTQVADAMTVYADELNSTLAALETSVNTALQEQQKQLTAEETQRLQAVVAELQESRRTLDKSSPMSIAGSSFTIAGTQQTLLSLQSEALQPYQQQWQNILADYSANTDQFMQNLSISGSTE